MSEQTDLTAEKSLETKVEYMYDRMKTMKEARNYTRLAVDQHSSMQEVISVMRMHLIEAVLMHNPKAAVYANHLRQRRKYICI